MRKYTVNDFDREFPTDEACLEWLRNYLYPDGVFCKVCGEVTKHHRVKSRPSYSCDRCGHHVHPMAGTIFEDTRTPLRTWFHAVFLMASTRCGISAKQLEREIGVTYKTAWRMFHLIRTLLCEDIDRLSGEIEADETYVGGRRRGRDFRGRQVGGNSNKTPVVGVVQRGGKVTALVTKDASARSLMPIIEEKVMPRSLVYTDEWLGYHSLTRRGFEHKRIAHAEKVYVMGRIHTNTIEGFWSILKRGIAGVYHSVSAKHLQSYVNEYAFRYNHRSDEQPMFQTMLGLVSR